MIDKFAGLPTQIRNLEKRLKEMDAAKVKPARIKELTDTIKNLKDMLKEKQEKREQRKREKEEKAKEVQVEAAPVPNPGAIGATAPNAPTPNQVGQPEATPTTPDSQKVQCPLCGGMTFADQAALQQHMQFTHASNVAPTEPGQKLDKTVAAVEVKDDTVEMPKGEFVKEHEKLVKELEPMVEQHKEQGEELKEVKQAEPKFKLDDQVKPIRGSESLGRVMRWDGKDNDLVYVMWDSGPLKERDVFGGYYASDLQPHKVEIKSESAPAPCPKCEDMQLKQSDLRENYEALLKDLKEERDTHFTQGNSAWVARLEQKISDLEKAMAERFPNEKTSELDKHASTDYYPQGKITTKQLRSIPGLKIERGSDGHLYATIDGDNYLSVELYDGKVTFARYGMNRVEDIIEAISAATGVEILDEYTMQDKWHEEHAAPGHKCDENCMLYGLENEASMTHKQAGVLWTDVYDRKVVPATGDWGVEAPQVGWIAKSSNGITGTVTGADDKFVYLKTDRAIDPSEFHDLFISDVQYKRKEHPKGVYSVSAEAFYPRFGVWKLFDGAGNEIAPKPEKQAGAQNAEQLTVMDHTPPRANSGPDAGGKDPKDEFQDEWAMPVTSATKINVLKRELLATPTEKGYDISQAGKKLFNLAGKDSKPMNKKQLEFCAEIELTRGMKRAKLVEKIAFLKSGTPVYILAEDKNRKRVKFASIEQGLRGWIPTSKVSFVTKKADPMRHGDHVDDVLGSSKSAYLTECPQGSGNMRWIQGSELLPTTPPPATPESLGDIEAAQKLSPEQKALAQHYQECGKDPSMCPECIAAAKMHSRLDKKKKASQKRPFSKKAFNEYTDCKKCGHLKGEHGNDKVCRKCEKHCDYIPKTADMNFPLSLFTRPEVKERADMFGLIDVEDADLTPAGLAAKKQEMIEGHDIEGAPKGPEYKLTPDMICHQCEQGLALPGKGMCQDCYKEFLNTHPEIRNDKESLRQALPPIIPDERAHVNATDNGPSDEDVQQKAWEMFKAHWNALSSDQMDQVYKALGVTASLNKEARVVHREDGWHVLSEKGKNLGGPYKSKAQAVKRLRQVEYFKHHGSFKPFNKKAVEVVDPYAALTEHVNQMRDRMTQVQNNLPKTAEAKNPIEWNGQKYFGLLVDMEGNIVSGYTYEQGEEAGWDLYFTPEEEVAWDDNELVYVYTDGKSPELNFQWGYVAGPYRTPLSDAEEKALEQQLLPKIMSQIKLDMSQTAEASKKIAARPDPDDPNNPDSPGYKLDEDDLLDSFVQLKNGQFALVQRGNEGGIIEVDLLSKTPTGYKYVTDSPIPVPVSAIKRELDWDEIQALNIEDKPWLGETSATKQADAPVTPDPMIQNVQPTDDDNLNVPVSAPTSPLPPGQKWVFDTQFNKYVAMPDPAQPGKQI